MELIKNFDKTLEMGRRIYNSKMIEKTEDGKVVYSDDEAIKALCSKVFTSDGDYTSIENLRSFNKLIVETANSEAKAKFEQIINAVSDFQSVGRYDQIVYYKVPLRTQTTMQLSASASGVDFIKIPSRQSKVPAVPKKYQFGVKYQISEMVNDPINAFRTAVDGVVQAKIEFIFKEIMKLAKAGKDAGKIPASQYADGAGLTLSAFRAIENKLLRAGRNVRPVLIADTNFISDLVLKQGTEGLGGVSLSWLTDEMRQSFLRDITFDAVSRSIAIATDNPFIDETNSAVDLSVNEALVIAGSDSGSPFKITEYGAMRTAQDMPSIEKEEVLIKVDYVVDVTLLLGNKLAYIRNTAVTKSDRSHVVL